MSDTNSLRTRIASELGRELSSGFGLSGETFATAVNRSINGAIRHYESTRMRFNEKKNNEFAATVSGQRTYSLPADFVAMDSLKISYSGNWITVRKREWEELDFRDTRVDGSSTGIPTMYAIGGNVVRVFPVPNSQTMTFYASYIRRFLPTSVTASYTSVVPVPGGGTLTVTTTASHNNRINGWTVDAEQLIRARAKAHLRIAYLKQAAAIEEAAGLAMRGEDYLSLEERTAFLALNAQTFDAVSTGRLEPYRL